MDDCGEKKLMHFSLIIPEAHLFEGRKGIYNSHASSQSFKCLLASTDFHGKWREIDTPNDDFLYVFSRKFSRSPKLRLISTYAVP